MTVAGSSPSLDYHEALAALADRGRFGINLGLGRTKALLHALGDPQRSMRGALVAGTNGKGSVLALASSALRAAGRRVGETPKPHLVSYRERIVVDGRPIDAADFARHVGAVLAVADEVAHDHGQPTEFELLTAVVFRHFAESNLDVALVEVGLGGRLDATHVWDGGVAVVTNVALDHIDRLGPTVVAIAREKAAIIEHGDLAVTGATGDALDVVRRRARRVAAPLTVVPAPALLAQDLDGISVELPGLGPTRVSLRGRHQAHNAAVADALLDALEAAGIVAVAPAERRRGYATASWPGRLELIDVPGGGRLLLDGAHNPAGATALADAVTDLRPLLGAGSTIPIGDGGPQRRPGGSVPITLVMAAMADKDIAGLVAALADSDAFATARVIATSVPHQARTLAADELARAWREHGPGLGKHGPARREILVIPDPIEATERAISTGGTDGLTVVAGSLYLVGAVRDQYVEDPALRDPPPVHPGETLAP